MAIAGAIPSAFGLWMGIDLVRKGRQAFKKVLFIKNALSGDFSAFLRGKAELPLESRSLFKTAFYLLFAGVKVIKLSRQKKRVAAAIDKLRAGWRAELAATPLESKVKLHWKRFKLTGQNALACAVEVFVTLKLMYDLWDFCVSTDEERDRMIYSSLRGFAFNIITNIQHIHSEAYAVREGLDVLVEMGRRMGKTFFVNVASQRLAPALQFLYAQYTPRLRLVERLDALSVKVFAFIEKKYFSPPEIVVTPVTLSPVRSPPLLKSLAPPAEPELVPLPKKKLNIIEEWILRQEEKERQYKLERLARGEVDTPPVMMVKKIEQNSDWFGWLPFEWGESYASVEASYYDYRPDYTKSFSQWLAEDPIHNIGFLILRRLPKLKY